MSLFESGVRMQDRQRRAPQASRARQAGVPAARRTVRQGATQARQGSALDSVKAAAGRVAAGLGRGAARVRDFMRRRAEKRQARLHPVLPANRAERRAMLKKLKRQQKIRMIARRIGLCVLTFIALVLVAALGAGHVGFKGPSQTLGDTLTMTMQETSALKFIPRIYYSRSELEEIFARNKVAEVDEETDTSMIVLAGPTPEPGSPEALAAQSTPAPANLISSEDGIEVYTVKGATYNGWMMVVQDPSRVGVGVCRENFSSKPGLELYEIAQRYGAVGAINGGGFSDDGGVGNGGRPIGLVVSNGQVLNKASTQTEHSIAAGFNQDNVLIVGKMTSTEAQEKGIRDALAFGPALVVNGEAAPVKGSSSGLNPRTAIGQRADGAVLMLVIDGRTASSLGATYADMISVLLEYGAVNAVNMDGGSSSLMYYKGEYLNRGVILTGSRKMPTGFIVK